MSFDKEKLQEQIKRIQAMMADPEDVLPNIETILHCRKMDVDRLQDLSLLSDKANACYERIENSNKQLKRLLGL